MTASLVLDRLARVRPTRPGQWMTACPICESRKGRPLAVTERDGMVLMHAFCGCSTEDVLGRIGLTVNDLFEKPLAHSTPSNAPRIPAQDVLASLSTEATVLAVIASDMLENRFTTEQTWQRLAACVTRITHAADYLNSK